MEIELCPREKGIICSVPVMCSLFNCLGNLYETRSHFADEDTETGRLASPNHAVVTCSRTRIEIVVGHSSSLNNMDSVLPRWTVIYIS